MEYAKYIPVEGLNVSGLTDSIANKVFTIGQDRQAKKTELANLQQELLDKSVIPMTETASINDHITKITSEYQDKIMEMYRQMTSGNLNPAEFKRFSETAKTNIDTYGKFANDLDKKFQDMAKRIQSGEGGTLQGEYARLLEEVTSLNNVQRVDENGRIVVDILDANGQVKQTVGLDYLNKPGKLVANKIDLQKNLSDAMDKWDAQGMWQSLARGGSVSWETIRENSGWKTASRALANAQLAGDGLQSVLFDHGGIRTPIFAYSQADAKAKIDASIKEMIEINGGKELTAEQLQEIEDSVVLMNGTTPVFTESQKKKAFDTVMKNIEVRAAEKMNMKIDRGYTPSSSGSSGSSLNNDLKVGSAFEGYKITVDAMMADPSNKAAFQKLIDYSKNSGNPIDVKKVKKNGKWVVMVYPKEEYKDFEYKYFKDYLKGKYGINDPKSMSDIALRDKYYAEFQGYLRNKDNKTKTYYRRTGESKEFDTAQGLSDYVFKGEPGYAAQMWKLGETESVDSSGLTYGQREQARVKGASNNNLGTTTNNNTSTGLSGGTVR